ncbi:M15 family metallopeptidase domain-containing protein [Flavisphingomonas formosensis]|uniref:M15 family peptidase n=1 Tax=Flavisphingomonas formosensis TaxID=861534 RepID=UPI0012F7E917|nr:M15 family peptidase [Sphingomonas formosensis]
MTYSLGAKSLANLSGVHPAIAHVVCRAITITEQDFSVYEGLRTQATQDAYLGRGVTKVKFSQHMKQADGYGHAVDLVPWIEGANRWEWPLIYPIASAMRAAAAERGVSLRWGGVWDRALLELGRSPASLKKAVSEYCTRHPGPDFFDGPHFELAR